MHRFIDEIMVSEGVKRADLNLGQRKSSQKTSKYLVSRQTKLKIGHNKRKKKSILVITTG